MLKFIYIIASVIQIKDDLKWWYDEIKGKHYNEEGFNRYGYNEEGFDKNGFDKAGYNIEGYDIEGYNRKGFNKDGFNRNGFDEKGFNREGLDKEGYNIKGYDKYGFDRAKHNREYYISKLHQLKKDNDNINKSSSKYRNKMFEYRFELETLLKMLIEHYKGKIILDFNDKEFLNRYIDIVCKYKLIDLSEKEILGIKKAKNYFGNYVHPRDYSIDKYKEEKAIESLKKLYDNVYAKLDLS